MKNRKNAELIISYLTLRKLIGILGMALPFICVFLGYVVSNLPVQRSISFYYHTNVRDFFVGLMISVSLFLITYKGYAFIDNVVSTMSGIAGFGIAVFPCLFSETCSERMGLFDLDPVVSNKVHLSFAALFFILLALNSIFLFTKTSKKTKVTGNKRKRNAIYRACGIAILSLLALLLILMLVADEGFIREKRIVLIIEALMLVAFGFSWLVKGETILKDQYDRGAAERTRRKLLRQRPWVRA